jgi:O-antigen/teichoic acid export membrane protein
MAREADEGRGARWRAAVPAAAGPVALANLAAGVASIAGVVLLTRLLAAEGYGLYAAAIGLVTLVQNVGYLAIQTSLIRFHARAADEEAEQRLGTALRIAFVLTSLAAAAVWLVAAHWLRTAGVTAGLAVAGLCLLLARGWLSIVQAWNRAKGRPWMYFTLEAAQSFGALALAVAALQLAPGAPAAALWAAAAATALAAAFSPSLLLMPVRREGTAALLREIFGYGAPLALVFLATAALAVSDRLIVAVYAGPAAAGAYAVAFAVADRALNFVLLPIPVAAKPALFAAWEEGGAAAARPILMRSARWLIAIGFPVATVLVFAPGPIARLLAGGGLAADAARMIPWLAVGSLLSCLLLLHFSLAFQLSRKTLWMLAAVGPPAAINLVANLVLVPRYGMIAAGWTTVACYALAVGLTLAIGGRAVRIPFPAGTMLRTAALCVPLAFLAAAAAR